MAVYPGDIKQFKIYSDFVDIDYAANDNEQGAEITAIEQTLGKNPQGPFPTVAAFLLNLYAGTNPLPHTHAHDPSAPNGMALTDLGSDTHLQYSRTDGTRDFTGAVGGQDPVLPKHLTTKHINDTTNSQILAQSESYAYAQAQAALQQADAYTDIQLLNRVKGNTAGFNPLSGPLIPPGVPLTLVGGETQQISDADSLIYISFEGVFNTTLQSMTVNIMDEAGQWALAGPGFPNQGYGAWPQFTTFHIESWQAKSAKVRLGWAGDAAPAAGSSFSPNGQTGATSATSGRPNLGNPPFSPFPGYWIRLCFTALGY